jgi:hypothetical protein
VRSRALAASSLFVFVLSATPTPNLNALGAVLAGPPDTTWVEDKVGSDTLEGPFGATFYVNTEWSNQSDRDTIKNALVNDGFIGGFGRSFSRSTPDSYIVEDVKAFPDAAHAMSNYQWAQGYWHDPNDTANNVSTPSIPSSFGQRYTAGDWKAIDIYFTKANYVFTVSVGAKTDYLTDVAVGQAGKVYDFAPTRDVLQPNNSQSGASAASAGVLGVGAAVIILVIVVTAVVLILVARRRRVPAGHYATLSPDGNYWWDGTAWQPVVRR